MLNETVIPNDLHSAQYVAAISIPDRFSLVAALAAAFAFFSCFFRLFLFSHTPLLPAGDALFFYISGSRIVAGQLPYRDFVEILPAGTDLAYAAMIRLFGFYTWVPGFAMSCLAAGVALLMTLAARRIVRGFAAALPSLLFTGFALSSETLNATHHWFCTLAALGAMLVLLGGTAYARAAAAGALAGIAACFTQTAGATVLILLGVYLIWGYAGRPEGWRKALCMCLAAIAIFTAVNAPFVWRVGFREWFDNVIVFPVRYFGVPDFNNWRVLRVDFAIHPSFERWIFFPFVYATSALVPAVLAYLILRTIRARRNRTIERDHAVMLIALTGAGMLLAVTPSPSLLRLASASPPGLILLVWLLQDGSRPARIVKASLATIAIALSIVVPLQHQFRRHATLDFPGGRTAFYDLRQYSEYQWLAGHTGPGEYFFGAPSMFVAFRVVNPAPVAVLDTSDYTRPEQVAATLASFRRKRPLLIVTRIPITELVRSASDHTEPFRDYVRTNYKLAKVFATGDAVWEAPLDKTE